MKVTKKITILWNIINKQCEQAVRLTLKGQTIIGYSSTSNTALQNSDCLRTTVDLIFNNKNDTTKETNLSGKLVSLRWKHSKTN